MAENKQNNTTQKRGPGRPPGSKNKPKTDSSSAGKSASKAKAADPEQAKIEKITSMQNQYDQDRRNVDIIWSITLFALGLFLFFTVVMDTTGSFGATVHDLCMGLFGIMAYVLPFFVLVFAVLLLARKMQHFSGRTMIFTLLIFLNMCILNSYRFIDPNQLLYGFGDIAQYYVDGVSGNGGGALGMELGSLIVKFFGKPGLLIIAITVLIISIFLVANTPISRFFSRMLLKHEQNKIMREMELAEAAKVQMAVARTATPGADPDTGVVKGGVAPVNEDPGIAGSAKSLWKSIINGISKLDDDPESVPSQKDQYNALRNQNEVPRTEPQRNIVQPLEAPAHRVDNITDESQIEYTKVLGRDTFMDRIARRFTGAIKPVSRDTAEVRPISFDMNYDDVDTGDYGYPGRKSTPAPVKPADPEPAGPVPVQGNRSRGIDGNVESYRGKAGKQYGLGDPNDFGHSGGFGLDGHRSGNSGRGLDDYSYSSGNAAGAGLAMNRESGLPGYEKVSGSGLDNGYKEANERRKKISGNSTEANKGLNDESRQSSGKGKKSKGLQEAQKRTAEDDALAAGFNSMAEDASYVLPSPSLLKKPTGSRQLMSDYQLEQKADLLEKTLNDFGVDAKVLTVTQGSSVTRYEVQPATGVKVSSITKLTDDIALNMRAKSIRIEAPIPGKAAVGIEVENEKPSPVFIRELIESEEFQSAGSKIEFVVGKDISGNNIVADLKDMPHLLIAGATGSGKSVCINTIITSFLYKAKPSELKLIMIDPKVVELANYNGIPHLLTPVVTDARKASRALAIAVEEMDKRYGLFAENGVKDLVSYNELMMANHEPQNRKPQVVIIIDELADLMMAAPSEVESSICRLAQKARAAGMHLIVATQRPSVDVVTGLIKANIPSRIAFSVASQVDSRTILDMAGAEKLLGKGDMLFSPVGSTKPYRVQGPFISDSETEKVIKFVKNEGGGPVYDEEIQQKIESGDKRGGSEPQDELTEDAIAFILKSRQASVSMLQRRFRIGYNRAARIIDEIEDKGIIGPSDGSRPRQVLITEDEYYNGSKGAAEADEQYEVDPQRMAEIEKAVVGKPHMDLNANGRSQTRTANDAPAAPVNKREAVQIPVPGAETVESDHDYSAEEDTYSTEVPSTGNSAVDYFNSLPESVRQMLLNSDDNK